MQLQAAKSNASDWSTIFAGMIPGLSSNSNSFLVDVDEGDEPLELALDSSVLTRIHCSDLVTPGVLAVRARLRPRILLINADFPTFGYLRGERKWNKPSQTMPLNTPTVQ